MTKLKKKITDRICKCNERVLMKSSEMFSTKYLSTHRKCKNAFFVDQKIAINERTAVYGVVQKRNDLIADASENFASDLHANTEYSQKELEDNTEDNWTPYDLNR